jgi:hypothetical protein
MRHLCPWVCPCLGSDDCGHDYFVAFSCKGRGVCPSCNTRRMVEMAAHLSDSVFLRLPVRQWVLSFPKRLRYFIQRDGAVLNMVQRIFLKVIGAGTGANICGSKAIGSDNVNMSAGKPTGGRRMNAGNGNRTADAGDGIDAQSTGR